MNKKNDNHQIPNEYLDIGYGQFNESVDDDLKETDESADIDLSEIEMIDFKGINASVNAMAMELVKFKPADINTKPIKELQNSITCELSNIFYRMPCKMDWNNNETHYYPLIKKFVPNDVFIETLYKMLGLKDDGWYYEPIKNGKKRTFITALRFLLLRRLIDYNKKNDKPENKRTIPLEDIRDNTKYTVNIEDEEPIRQMMKGIINFAEILNDYGKLYEHATETNKSNKKQEKLKKYFKSYFTYDTTRAVKSHDELWDVACEYNDVIIPHIDKPFVRHILFIDKKENITMYIIIHSDWCNEEDSRKRGALVASFHGISHPTENYYSQQYDKIKNAIIRSINMTLY